MKYTKRTPCKMCPFRNDAGRLYVHPTTLRGMAAGEFCCHETGVANDETGAIEPTERSLHCAGALIFLEKIGEPTQMMRIADRLGLYDPGKLDMSAPVFESWDEVDEQQETHPLAKRYRRARA